MNINEKLMQQLINDPALMKTLEKLAKANGAEIAKAPREKKLKELGNPSHVYRVLRRCKLCSSEHISYMRMDWDSSEKLYRGGCYHLDNIWPHLPVYEMKQFRPSCNDCPSALADLSKDTLIAKLIVQAERIHAHV